jgi:glutamyl-tRNA(Gln) amidotransferase subunit E
MGLIKLAEELAKRRVSKVEAKEKDVSDLLSKSKSKIIQNELAARGRIFCVSAEGFDGLLGFEPYPQIRLGKELAEVARANSLGGVIHSDEFEKQGISKEEAHAIRKALGAGEHSGLVLIAGDERLVKSAAKGIMLRLSAALSGVPAETRAATEEGESRYLRPRPGPARMYPETDIPEVVVTEGRRESLFGMLPESWEEKVRGIEREFSLSAEQALQVYDSELSDVFVETARESKLEPSLIASVMVEMPVRLSREGVPQEKLGAPVLLELIALLEKGAIAKEAVPEVLRKVGTGEAKNVEEAAAVLGLRPMSTRDLEALVDQVIKEKEELVTQTGENAFSPLMGEVMKRARGRIDGKLVSEVLRKKLRKAAK